MSFKEIDYKEYNHVITKSYEIYDDEPVKRIHYVKKNVPSEIYNIFLLETLQWELCILTSQGVHFSTDHLELICMYFAKEIGHLENETKLIFQQFMGGIVKN